jgi:anti-sigma factor RsiW
MTCRELDEHLAPYLDCEATPAVRGAVDAHLEGCASCREHVAAEAAARAVLHERCAALRAVAPPDLRARCAALQCAAATRRSAMSFLRRWAPLSLAATLVLAVAGVFLFGLNDRVEALAASLAVDHVKCFNKVNGPAANADASLAERDWRHDQGWPIVVPQSSAAQQLTLVDVRRCLSTDGRAAHMMYTWRGAPLSLYVLPQDGKQDRVVDRMGHETVIWCANRRTYAVVAEGHPQDLADVVGYMKAHAR